uniref:Zinc finger CCCH domain-containing protein 19 n=1 Tax=Tanacetum cinerariifolium TaxID=118510 RepID=A0A6L2MII4_TANCI|nr:zinc finger CCCH domain-containing protein 19 [Tanacetum cinerariifolium]
MEQEGFFVMVIRRLEWPGSGRRGDSKALVTIDGEDIDWSGHVEEDAQNYAMMAYSSSKSSYDNKVKSCSKACEESYARIKKIYDDQRDKLGDASVEITAYTLALKKTSSDESNSKPSKYASCKSDSSVETSTSMPEPVENASKVICEPKVWTDAPIIEEYESDSDNDLVSNVQEDKEKLSFAFTDSIKHVKTSRENIKETCTTNSSPKIVKQDRNCHTRKGLGYALTRKDDPYRALKDKEIVDSGCLTGVFLHPFNLQIIQTNTSIPEVVEDLSSLDRSSDKAERLAHHNNGLDDLDISLDPDGNVQGSFSLAQLRMWKDYFPSDIKIWSYYGNVKETILLHSALKRRTKDAG